MEGWRRAPSLIQALREASCAGGARRRRRRRGAGRGGGGGVPVTRQHDAAESVMG